MTDRFHLCSFTGNTPEPGVWRRLVSGVKCASMTLCPIHDSGTIELGPQRFPALAIICAYASFAVTLGRWLSCPDVAGLVSVAGGVLVEFVGMGSSRYGWG